MSQGSGPEPLTSFAQDRLEALVVAHGGQKFQGRQLAHWLYKHGARSLDECRNLPAALRSALGAQPVRGSEVVKNDRSEDGTEKLLVRLRDGEHVECVLIPEGERTTLCVSTQVGCPIRCVFCASGLEGVRRNLDAGEIVEQVLHARERLPAERTLTNLVVMGIGEPMLNLENLLAALERIHDPAGINLGARRITVSTSGLPDRIRQFASVPHAYNLAVSLHSADDELRRRLVPAARATVAEIVAAARDYAATRRREVTFEVVLLRGVNDREQDAQQLIATLRDGACTVNLIPYNPVAQIPELQRPEPVRVQGFAARLAAGGLKVTVRRQRGADRSAACGQLRIMA